MNETLEQLLAELAALQPVAQRLYEAEQREAEEDDEWEPDGAVWLALEYDHDDKVWMCGWNVQPDEATEWALTPWVHPDPRQAVLEALGELRGRADG
ncbi:MAG: hypothetical protein OHK0022_27680 [Roseiflexaceae bacterium]